MVEINKIVMKKGCCLTSTNPTPIQNHKYRLIFQEVIKALAY